MLTASNGLRFYLASDDNEKREAYDYAVLFYGAPACGPSDETGFPPEAVKGSLDIAQKASGGLTWVIAKDGDLMVGAIACAMHTNGVHRWIVSVWLAPGYQQDENRVNLSFAAELLLPSDQCPLCDGRLLVTLPRNGVEYTQNVVAACEILSETEVPRPDGAGPSGLVCVVARPIPGVAAVT